MRFDDPSTLHFFFDFISHNAYLAWGRVQDIVREHGLHVEPVPVVFGALLKHHGQLGPAEIPAKSRWMLRDVMRKACLLKLPLAPPHSHPFNPLPALRLSCCEQGDAATRVQLIDRVWRATWAEGREVSNELVLHELLEELGLPAQAMLEESHSEPVKQCLRANTDCAIEQGVFGVPSVLVRGELFWGYDDLDALMRFLEGRDPLIAAPELSAWMRVRSSVERRR